METLVLAIDGGVTLRMPSLATAGYTWELVSPPQAVVEVRRGRAGDPASSAPLAGQSPDEAFDIRGLARGTVVLTFVQRRRWEQGKPPHAMREIEVRVE